MTESTPLEGERLPGSVVSTEVGGKDVFLLGTAHVSRKSVEDVEVALAAVRPDTVCVELCESRFRSLTDPESWRTLNILQILKDGKATLLLGSLIMTSFQRRIADRLGIKPGAEMLAAVEGARARGAELVLADRSIEITLKRTGARLGFWTKIKVFSQLLAGLFVQDEIDEEEIERLKQREHLADALQALARGFPQAKETLIDERDTYLSQKIRQAPGQRILAVVGAGHVEGILEKIGHTFPLEPLETLPRASLWPRILKWAIPLVIIGLLAYGFFTGEPTESRGSLYLWFLINGGLSALGAAIALGHPLTVASACLAAPLTSLNPLIAAGWVAGVVQAWVKNPTVQDLEDLPDAITSVRGFWRNPVTRILLVVVLANLGSTLGTFIAGSLIAARAL